LPALYCWEWMSPLPARGNGDGWRGGFWRRRGCLCCGAAGRAEIR